MANYNKNMNMNKNQNKNTSSSSNATTTTYLATHDFNLLYSRREEEGEGEFIATLVSINPISGILEAKIEPSASRIGGERRRRRRGKTHEEAFAALKRYVEVILGEVLKSVPDAVAIADADASASASSSPSEIAIEQQPPAYNVGRDALFVEDGGGGGVGKS